MNVHVIDNVHLVNRGTQVLSKNCKTVAFGLQVPRGDNRIISVLLQMAHCPNGARGLANGAMFDPQEFRNALGCFVTGVTIVTALDSSGQPVGLTANSFNSVSLGPPMVLWSLSLHSSNLPVFRTADSWAVHVLAADQQAMSDRFATPGVDRFAGLSTGNGPEGAPLIEGYAARFGCKARFEYEGGDHAIFLGEVVDFDRRDADPLIYHSGRYGRVALPEERALTGEDLEREGFALRRGETLSLTERGAEMLAALDQLSKR